MQRFVSDPLALPATEGAVWSRADLLVYGVDHSGPSYEVRAFLDAPDADHTTPLTLEHGYGGVFTVFGHGGCFGDRAHCDPEDRLTDDFDVRLPHQSLPQTKLIVLTDAMQGVTGSSVQVTLVAVEPGDDDAAKPSDAFNCTEIRIVTYAKAELATATALPEAAPPPRTPDWDLPIPDLPTPPTKAKPGKGKARKKS